MNRYVLYIIIGFVVLLLGLGVYNREFDKEKFMNSCEKSMQYWQCVKEWECLREPFQCLPPDTIEGILNGQ